VHEPRVACIAKGKARKRYEFGAKVSVAATSRGGWFVGAMAMRDNPYDGHTLGVTLAQVARLARAPQHAFVGRGDRTGHRASQTRTPHGSLPGAFKPAANSEQATARQEALRECTRSDQALPQ